MGAETVSRRTVNPPRETDVKVATGTRHALPIIAGLSEKPAPEIEASAHLRVRVVAPTIGL